MHVIKHMCLHAMHSFWKSMFFVTSLFSLAMQGELSQQLTPSVQTCGLNMRIDHSQAMLSRLQSTPSDSNCIRSYISHISIYFRVSNLDNDCIFDMRTRLLLLYFSFESPLSSFLIFKWSDSLRFKFFQTDRSHSDQPGQIGRPKWKARPRRSMGCLGY